MAHKHSEVLLEISGCNGLDEQMKLMSLMVFYSLDCGYMYLQVQKKHYRKEKKRAAKELLSTLKDPSVIVMADWLKVRGTLKGWTKLWCVLKPGLLVLYKSHKQKVLGIAPHESSLLTVGSQPHSGFLPCKADSSISICPVLWWLG